MARSRKVNGAAGIAWSQLRKLDAGRECKGPEGRRWLAGP